MPASKNQHYIPKCYFRQYSQHAKLIDVHLFKDDLFRHAVPIKTQASADYFYGNELTEQAIGELENIIRSPISRLSKQTNSPIKATEEDRFGILRYMLFQRARTNNEREKRADADNIMIRELERSRLENSDFKNKEFLLQHIDKIKFSYTQPNGMAMVHAIEVGHYAVDLGMVVLEAAPARPFVFGDSPVCLYNHYLINIKHRGVLGLTTPGLLMFFPLSPRWCLVAFDRELYDLPASPVEISVHQLSNHDADEVNKLQYLNAHACIYFTGRDHAEYLGGIWNAVKGIYNPPKTKCYIVPGRYHGETESFGEVMHAYEPQINYVAQFSFAKASPIAEIDYKPRQRNAAFARQVDVMLGKDKLFDTETE